MEGRTRAEHEYPVRAIAMWDFSWLERRWPGAGYEDWDQVLDELAERGYDSVRIDPYPHLLACDPAAEWELLPVWDQNDWGSPAPINVRVQPSLIEFVTRCAKRDIAVALSSWFRPDRTGAHMRLRGPQDLAHTWIAALDALAAADLLGSLLYVDLCNEYPLTLWAPWLRHATGRDDPSRADAEVHRWMAESLTAVRTAYPSLSYCFSFATELRDRAEQDVSGFDLLEPHVWMAHPEVSEFHDIVGYDLEACRFDPRQWATMVAQGERSYRDRPQYWERLLRAAIDDLAHWSQISGKPLVTTEGWAVVNYKDWPGASWGWIKELCEFGVDAALQTRRWVAICTSNFCGPQFPGMWRDIAWHRELTDRMHRSYSTVPLPSDKVELSATNQKGR